MNPQVLTVSKISQGSNDPDKPWSKARFCFMKQLAIRFGKLDPTKILDPAIPNLEYKVVGEFFLCRYFLGGGRNRGSSLRPTGRRQTHQGGINSPCD